MINLNELTIDLKECEKLLDEFKNLLNTNDEIREGKADGLLKFFVVDFKTVDVFTDSPNNH